MESLERLARAALDYLPWLVSAAIVLILAWGVAAILRKAIHTAASRGHLHRNLALVLSRLSTAATMIIGILIAAVIVFPTFRPGDLIAGLGITSVAVGFAFKDVLQNFFAGILILWREPFRIGDQIRAGEFEGTVEDINVRSTRLKTYDGERAVLPNATVYTNAILVRTAYDVRRARFTVGVGYQDSIDEAREAIHRVLRETEGVRADPPPWVYVAELAPSSVNFNVYFWTGSCQKELLATADRVATGVKKALDAAHIDMPYPHTVVVFKKDLPFESSDPPRR